MEKSNNFERSLPENYVLLEHVDVRNDKKRVQRYALLSYLPLIVIVPILCVTANACSGYHLFRNWKSDHVFIVILIACAVNLFYTVLHELIHGITYKCCTGGKLTFGFTAAAGFCGVPDLYVRKKASFAALIMPFAVFTVVFTGLTVGLWRVKPLYGIAAGFVLSLHLGGCAGDLVWALLYLTKFRRCNTLRRDAGPEQWLYIPREEAEEYGITPLEETKEKTVPYI